MSQLLTNRSSLQGPQESRDSRSAGGGQEGVPEGDGGAGEQQGGRRGFRGREAGPKVGGDIQEISAVPADSIFMF